MTSKKPKNDLNSNLSIIDHQSPSYQMKLPSLQGSNKYSVNKSLLPSTQSDVSEYYGTIDYNDRGYKKKINRSPEGYEPGSGYLKRNGSLPAQL